MTSFHFGIVRPIFIKYDHIEIGQFVLALKIDKNGLQCGRLYHEM